MQSKHCDSCKLPTTGIYTLTEYTYPPSYLCDDHGKKFVRDARENRIKFSVKSLDKGRSKEPVS